MPRAFQINPADNVATMLDDVTAGTRVELLGGSQPSELVATEAIANAHKIAVVAIPAGGPVIKFGVTIGIATQDIAVGSWVHLHNVASRFDQRSPTLDVHTGATTDTKYE